MEQEFVWDETKRRRNLAKHGLDFANIGQFDFDGSYEIMQSVIEHGELRTKSIGLLNGKVCVLVFAKRKTQIRVISLRVASKYEKAQFIEYYSY